ncbi:chitinase-3-like protein 1 [Cloeon dipterum]|uniref:chitinase-3-like protein 1 n=1 Tax=Cloeon dipterum TaxID=197152 RepID=UPI00321FA4F6
MATLALFSLLLLAFSSPIQAQKKIVCYVSSWSIYRPGDGFFNSSFVDPNICTHLIYAFISAHPNGSIMIRDPNADIRLGGFAKLNKLREANPTLVTMVSVGGSGTSSTTFSSICNDVTVRATFVNNLFDFVVSYKFNGLDVDWEYPTQKGGIPADKANYVSLIQELRAKFGPAGLLLSAAVSSSAYITSKAYDVPPISAALDFINLMTYDFHGVRDNKTGQNSPLYASSIDADKRYNANAAVQNWIKLGADRTKLILGAPLYGQTYTLLNPSKTELGAAIKGPGSPGKWSRQAGVLIYNEICSSMKSQTDWTEVWDEEQAVPYAYRSDQWVGYDNVKSVGIKSKYALDQGLGGVLVWSLDMDDFRNLCGAGKFPLVTALKANLVV